MGMTWQKKDKYYLRTQKLHDKGVITSTFTGDLLLMEGESRDKFEEWLKKTQVRHQDQRRILTSIMHCFPSNFWRSKITNRKESDKCDLCKSLWASQVRFTTETALPVHNLGHIQHTFEVLSELHVMEHHRCWWLIHRERSLLASPKWRFICINSENASVRFGKNWLRNSQRTSTNVWIKRSGTWQEIQNWDSL